MQREAFESRTLKLKEDNNLLQSKVESLEANQHLTLVIDQLENKINGMKT